MQMPGVSTTLDQLAADAGWLRRLARSLVQNPAAADDLVQDAYLLATEQPPGADRPLRPWLVRVLRNLTRTKDRVATRRSEREHQVAALAAAPATPAELVGRVELHRLLAGLVLELAPGSRDVVLLHYFEGLSSAAIATRLGITAGTVRWRLKQAIDELRERLDHREPNRAWLPALAAFAGPTPAAGMVVPWLGLAAIALLIGLVWLVAQTRADVREPRVMGGTSRVTTSDGAAPVVSRAPLASPVRPPGGGTLAPSTTPYRLEGRVVDDQRQAVEGAAIAVDCGYGEAGEALVRTTTTAGGTFTLELDETCRAHVSASKGDRLAQTMAFRELFTEPLVLTLVPRIVIRAHVVDATTGAPIAGAEVATAGAGTAPYRNTATTDDRGDAQVYAPGHPTGITVSPFPTDLFVRAAGYLPTHARVQEVPTPGANALDARTVRLTRGIAIRGQLIGGASYTGATIDVVGPMETTFDGPVQGSPLWIRRKGVEGDRVAADGSFEVRLLGPGRYWLLPRVDGVGPTSEAETRVDVGPDGRSDVVIHLGAHSGIVVTVVDLAGKPVAGALVTTPSGNMRPFVTDARGEVTVPVGAGPAGGPYRLLARSGSLASEVVAVALRHGQLLRKTLQLHVGGIAGVVVNAAGAPVPGAEVYRNPTDELTTGERATTDALGRFSFELPGGTFVLSVRRSSEDDFEDEVRVVSGSYNVYLMVP